MERIDREPTPRLAGALASDDAEQLPPIGRLKLTIQACDDEKCLQPEDLLLEVPLNSAGAPPVETISALPGLRGIVVAAIATIGAGAAALRWCPRL